MRYHGEESATLFYRISWIVAAPLVRLWARYEIKGLQWSDVPPGPLIVVANHVNWLDPVLIAYTCPRPMVLLAKEELFHEPVLGALIRKWGAIPVQRGKAEREMLRRCIEVLLNGGILGIFPEGRRNFEGELQRGLSGAAFIALRSGAAILPIGVAGTKGARVLPRPFHRPRAIINIGQPFRPPSAEGRAKRAELNTLTDMIMERVAELLPPSYRGVYGKRGTGSGTAVEFEARRG